MKPSGGEGTHNGESHTALTGAQTAIILQQICQEVLKLKVSQLLDPVRKKWLTLHTHSYCSSHEEHLLLL